MEGSTFEKLSEGQPFGWASAVHRLSWERRTALATRFLNPSRSSRHSLAASMLAGLSSLGDDSMEMIESMIVSTCTIHDIKRKGGAGGGE
jgi:hypothetical protein